MWETLLVVAGAFGATLLAIYLNNVVFKPVLFIDGSRDECMYDTTRQLWAHRLSVRNVGLRAATNCTATLSLKNIRREDVVKVVTMSSPGMTSYSSFMPPEMFSEAPVDLEEAYVPWSILFRPEKFAITINKGAGAKLNIFCTERDLDDEVPVLLVESLSEDRFRVGLMAHSNYEGEITVTAGNANPRRVRVVLEANGGQSPNLRIIAVRPRTLPRILRQLWVGQ